MAVKNNKARARAREFDVTDDELQAIKDRCVAASPRAWHATRHICREEYSVSAAYADVCSIRSDAAHCGADALFIAHARSDIPALLAHIAAQQAALEQAWYVLDAAAAGVAPKVAAVMARSHVEKFIGKRESNFGDDAEAWNALPRALTWTEEPPKVSGHYWCRYKLDSKEAWSVAYVPAVTDWDKRDMEEHDRIEWAGPIPMPKEPTP